MRKFTYAILVITILVGALLFFGDVQADTYVSGTINSNTTWTSANSPYTLTGDVIISNGVTLTVEPEVTVNFGSYKLYVNGALNAQGTSDNYIVLSGNGYSSIVFTSTSTDWSGSSGCIIDYAYFSEHSLVVEDSSPKISNSYFSSTYSTPITISGGIPEISNNVLVFDSCDCIRINSGSPIISYNVIAGNGEYYGIYTEGTASIYSNNITGCWTGIYAVGASTIRYNNIMENGNDGIRSENAVSLIENNVLANNNVGITGNGTIRINTIVNNGEAGIWGPSVLTNITRNNIYDNAQNVHLTESDDIEAFYNWWGTVDASEINQTIWDHKNDPDNLGTLYFDPYLTEPNSLAPSIPDSITIPSPPTTIEPTPTPTASPSETPSPSPSVTPTPDSTVSPSPTIAPTETPQESPVPVNITDIISIAVIVAAVLLALIVIVFINRKYGKSQSVNDDNVK